MPHEGDPDGGDLSEVSFTEPSEDGEEEEALSSLSNGLRTLNIGDSAAQSHIDVKASSASTRMFSQEPSPRGFQTHLVLECKHEPTRTIGGSVERAPGGWSRAFSSKP